MTDRPSIMITKKIPCGSVYCNFVENKTDGKFHKLLVFCDMARETPCGDSWIWAIARILTYSLRRAFREDNAEDAVSKQLFNHRCNKYVPGKERSCPDAISKAVKDYIKIKEKEAKKATPLGKTENIPIGGKGLPG